MLGKMPFGEWASLWPEFFDDWSYYALASPGTFDLFELIAGRLRLYDERCKSP